MEIGDTFLLARKNIDEHFWIVISHPQYNPECVIIVNLTSWHAIKDQSCILDPQDHDWIRHRTCISYQDAKCVSESKLDQLIAAGELRPHTSASPALLGKILQGAFLTDAMPNKCKQVLIEQDLIDGD